MYASMWQNIALDCLLLSVYIFCTFPCIYVFVWVCNNIIFIQFLGGHLAHIITCCWLYGCQQWVAVQDQHFSYVWGFSLIVNNIMTFNIEQLYVICHGVLIFRHSVIWRVKLMATFPLRFLNKRWTLEGKGN